MAKTLDDIFNDDDFGLLESKEVKSVVKTEEDRLIESFEEINIFYEKNEREPSGSSMSEVRLMMRLKGFRADERKKRFLKSHDRFNLLGEVEEIQSSLEDIFEDDDLGILDSKGDRSIFKFVHSPKPEKKSDADYIAQREPIPDKEFVKYEPLFQQVHKELKSGIRKLRRFENIEKNLQIGNFYLLDGLLLYLESADLTIERRDLKSGDRTRKDGRTITIFENGTQSNMLYRSLGKAIQKSGKMVTQPSFGYPETEVPVLTVSEADVESGWIYVLKSKSTKTEILGISNLFKVGFTTKKIGERLKNAKQEPAFLFSDVEVIASYRCYNLNAQKFENLLHRFFGEVCLDIDLYDETGQRANPREWFVVPLSIINQAINLLLSGEVIDYVYDAISRKIVRKY